jgi:hypothetical protein
MLEKQIVDIGPMIALMKKFQIDLYSQNNHEWAAPYDPSQPLTPESFALWVRDREGFFSQLFGKPRHIVQWWMHWRDEGFRCQSLNSKGKPCKNYVEDNSLENFEPGLSEYCFDHQEPEDRR